MPNLEQLLMQRAAKRPLLEKIMPRDPVSKPAVNPQSEEELLREREAWDAMMQQFQDVRDSNSEAPNFGQPVPIPKFPHPAMVKEVEAMAKRANGPMKYTTGKR